jgi:transposase
MARPSRFSPEVRDRAVRMVLEQQDKHESQWAAITSITEKIGCTAETLRKWVRQAERDQGVRPEDVEFATLEWVAWYNGSRLFEPPGYVSPAEFEQGLS